MNLADMLSFADITQLTQIAQCYGCRCSKHSKHELIQSILSSLNRKDVFEQHIHEMTLEELRFLNNILFDKRSFFSLEELIAQVQQAQFEINQNQTTKNKSTKKIHFRDTISKFKQSGWLFTGCSQQTKYLYQVPSDLKKRLFKLLKKSFMMQLTETEMPSSYRDEDSQMGEDILHLLQFIRDKRILLNAQGVMYKKTQQALLERFAVQEELVGRALWRFGYGRRFHDYPSRMSLIYDYSFYYGWIEEGDRQLFCTTKGMERLEKNERESTKELYQFWLQLYKQAIPNVLSLVYWIQICSQKWTTLESLEKTLLPFVKPYFFDSSQSVFRNRMIMMLIHLGVVRYGEDMTYGPLIQMTSQGKKMMDGIYAMCDDTIPSDVANRYIN